jgi:uncharacterized lipoprotein YddW (UPF0748 family)
LNVVYFNAWSRRRPLWRSQLFLQETGYATGPAAGERDTLREAIAEAHRRGLDIEPWMECGFYPQMNCGYDSVSVTLYQQEVGVPPPANFSDPGWMRWRADKQVAFHRTVCDSIKAANPYLTVSHAPSHDSSNTYYSAYGNFLRDRRAWLNNGILDQSQSAQAGWKKLGALFLAGEEADPSSVVFFCFLLTNPLVFSNMG